MMGRAALYEPIDNRRFHEDGRGYDAHEVEKAMLLDPNARLASIRLFRGVRRLRRNLSSRYIGQMMTA